MPSFPRVTLVLPSIHRCIGFFPLHAWKSVSLTSTTSWAPCTYEKSATMSSIWLYNNRQCYQYTKLLLIYKYIHCVIYSRLMSKVFITLNQNLTCFSICHLLIWNRHTWISEINLLRKWNNELKSFKYNFPWLSRMLINGNWCYLPIVFSIYNI